MASMRRSGSAAPQSSWSPTVNARDVLRAHLQLADAAHRDVQGAGGGDRGQRVDGGFLGVGHDLGPLVVRGQQLLDLGHGQVLGELEGQRLGVRAHGADAHAQPVHDDLVGLGVAQDLVGLHPGLPLLLGLAVAQVRVDPRDQRAGQRHAELGGVQPAALGGEDLAVDLQDRGGRVVQLGGDVVVDARRTGSAVRACAGRRRRRRPGRSSRCPTRPGRS